MSLMAGIRKKIILFYIATVLVVSITGFILYGAIRNVFYTQLVNDQNSALSNSRILVEEYIDDVEQVFWEVTMSKNIADFMAYETDDILEQYYKRNQLEKELDHIENIFMNQAKITLFLDGILPIEQVMSDWDSEPDLMGRIKTGAFNKDSVAEQEWYVKAIDNHDAANVFLSPYSNELVFIKGVNNPFLRRELMLGNDETAIVMVLRLKSSEIVNVLNNSALVEGSYIRVLDSKGEELVRYSDQRSEDEDYYIIEERLMNKWKMVAYIPEKAILSKTNVVIWYVGTALLAILLILIGQSLWVESRITRPILRLSRIMKDTTDIERLNMSLDFKHQYRDEIGLLYDDFANMNEQIKLSLKKVRASEYMALQAQINPHFLYNTLDSINWIALCQDQEQIADITGKLADILRYSINDPMALTTMNDELRHVREYVAIEKLRYDDAFVYDEEVDTSALNASIPKLILQPLVENAINHGAMKNEKGIVSLAVWLHEGRVGVRIGDNGRKADIESINNMLNIGDASKRRGIGIRNVHRRLVEEYGGSGLSYSTNDDGETIVEFSIKYHPKANRDLVFRR